MSIESSQPGYAARPRHRIRPTFGKAVIAGVIGAAIGAALWAGAVYIFQGEFVYLAAGVAILVTIGVLAYGQSDRPPYWILAGLLTFAGALAGEVMATYVLVAKELDVTITRVADRVPFGEMWDISLESASFLTWGLVIGGALAAAVLVQGIYGAPGIYSRLGGEAHFERPGTLPDPPVATPF